MSKASKKVIFCMGLYRSGTSLLWNLLRQDDRVTAYYEPTNTNHGDRLKLGGVMEDSSHIGLSDYYSEYTDLSERVTGLYDRCFGVDRLCLGGRDEHEQLEQYLNGLIDESESEVVVIKLMRNDFQMPWLKARFPSATIVHLRRNPRDVWTSVTKSLLDDEATDPWMNTGFDILVWACQMARSFPEIINFNAKSSYDRHYLLWCLSNQVAEKYADLCLDYERDLLVNTESTIQSIYTAARVMPSIVIENLASLVVQKNSNYIYCLSDKEFLEIEGDCKSLIDSSLLKKNIEERVLDESWPDLSDKLIGVKITSGFASLSKEISILRGRLSEYFEGMKKKDDYISSLEKNDEKNNKERVLAEKGHKEQVKLLTGEILKSQNYGESLSQLIVEKDIYIISLRSVVEKSEEYIPSLEQAIEEKDIYIASLETEYAKKDIDIVSLRSAVEKSEEYTPSLEQAIEEKDIYVSSLEKAISEKDEELKALKSHF